MYRNAIQNGDRTNARKTLDSLRAHFGVGAPERKHVTGSITMDLDKLSDEELEEAAGMAREIVVRSAERMTANGVKPDGEVGSSWARG